MEACQDPRGTLFHRERRIAVQAGCRRWACRPCGHRKARKVGNRFARLNPDFLLTLSLPRSAWPTPKSLAELQAGCRSLLRYMQRHRLITAYGWVRETGAPRSECVCSPSLDGCICGANGRQLHRHFLLRVGSGARNRYGRPWLPYARLQEAARRCGLGTLDLRPIVSRDGAARYVSKYLAKSLADERFNPVRARRYAFNVSIEELKEAGWCWTWARVARVAIEELGAYAVDWDATYWSAEAPPLLH